MITTTLASLLLRSRFFTYPCSLDLGSLPRLAIRESHLCLSTALICRPVHLPHLSCSLVLIYPKSYPSLFVFLPTFFCRLLIGHSSLPEFVSFDTTYSPSCYSTFSDNLFSNSSLEFTTWRGSLSSLLQLLFDSAPSVLTTSILDLLQFFQLQIQFLALLTCPFSIPGSIRFSPI